MVTGELGRDAYSCAAREHPPSADPIEPARRDAPLNPLRAPAEAHLSALLARRAITLLAAAGREDHDGYGRPLRHVDVASVDVGRQMIADGYAVARCGYQRHPRQDDYGTLDASTPAAC